MPSKNNRFLVFIYNTLVVFLGVALGFLALVAVTGQTSIIFYVFALFLYPAVFIAGLLLHVVLGNMRFGLGLVKGLAKNNVTQEIKQVEEKIVQSTEVLWPLYVPLFVFSGLTWGLTGLLSGLWGTLFFSLLITGIIYALVLRVMAKRGFINQFLHELFSGTDFGP